MPGFKSLSNHLVSSSNMFSEIFALVGWYTACFVSCLPTFRDSILVSSSKNKQSMKKYGIFSETVLTNVLYLGCPSQIS